MGFIDSYKRLEKLCGEVLNDDKRITAYIDEMKNIPQGSYFVKGWDEDLKMLKHYRWIRNQIAHEPGCTEGNMCNSGDVRWIENFYSRVMQQNDPLSLYSKAKKIKKKNSAKPQKYNKSKSKRKKKSKGLFKRVAFWLFVLAVIWLIVFVRKYIS